MQRLTKALIDFSTDLFGPLTPRQTQERDHQLAISFSLLSLLVGFTFFISFLTDIAHNQLSWTTGALIVCLAIPASINSYMFRKLRLTHDFEVTTQSDYKYWRRIARRQIIIDWFITVLFFIFALKLADYFDWTALIIVLIIITFSHWIRYRRLLRKIIFIKKQPFSDKKNNS
ncbi:hypothetical protein MUDAN_DOGOELCO_02279 [Lactiplantibacillus mudanjiangensis]|uniref:hypothetical protein n=1 Tax=Lactiplantibacillus mudanjiangensis TaxID=1296538 RepID=UPI0010149045|nr:hypothetical protein [Lactiplantibacillus mudanjiangensis]VDG33071.1 hypothetical protein MUDAN_DOGOELCO_02279 [Lactiplantibacillus mudanjiangensis]